MRHAKKRLQLNRFTSWHKATMKALARSVFIDQSIKTTRAKAFAVKPVIEKLITLAKKNTLFAKRQAYKVLCDHELVSKLFDDIGPRFKNRAGGYLRVLNLGKRRGDDANMVILELTEIVKRENIKKTKKAKEPAEKIKETPTKETPIEEVTKPRTEDAVKEEKHPEAKKPQKKFLGGIRNIFKKERDSL